MNNQTSKDKTLIQLLPNDIQPGPPDMGGQEVNCHIDTAKVEAWVKTGAQVSDRVAFLVKSLPAVTAAPAA